eukprot:5882178-Amphidinium_carterae.2
MVVETAQWALTSTLEKGCGVGTCVISWDFRLVLNIKFIAKMSGMFLVCVVERTQGQRHYDCDQDNGCHEGN